MAMQRRLRPPFNCASASSFLSYSSESKTIASSRAARHPINVVATAPSLLLLILLASLSIQLSSSFPSGAPEQACKELKPGHGAEPKTGSAPFELVQDRKEASAGDQIKVTLSSPSKATFKGLMVQALNENGEPSGKFLAGTGLKLIDSCSAVTHSDKEPKKTATLVWEPPADLKSKQAFTFRATVVQKFDEYYVGIKSTLQSA